MTENGKPAVRFPDSFNELTKDFVDLLKNLTAMSAIIFLSAEFYNNPCLLGPNPRVTPVFWTIFFVAVVGVFASIATFFGRRRKYESKRKDIFFMIVSMAMCFVFAIAVLAGATSYASRKQRPGAESVYCAKVVVPTSETAP